MDDRDSKKKTEHADDEVNDNPCIHSIFEKELDKRNYYLLLKKNWLTTKEILIDKGS